MDINLYGAYWDSSKLNLSDTFGIKLINLLDRGAPQKAFCKHPWIIQRYEFRKAPCINILLISPRVNEEGWPTNSNDWLIFNRCDSSSCYFGADPTEYFRTARVLIQEDSSDLNIINFILLYMYIQSTNSYFYHIMWSPIDFDSLYYYAAQKGYYSEDSLLRPPGKRLSDISLAHRSIRPIKIDRKHDEVEIELFTWEELGGDIDYWHFVITLKTMELLERSSILNEVGPYRMILH